MDLVRKKHGEREREGELRKVKEIENEKKNYLLVFVFLNQLLLNLDKQTETKKIPNKTAANGTGHLDNSILYQ